MQILEHCGFSGIEVPIYRYGGDEIVVGPNDIKLVAGSRGYFIPLEDIAFTGRCGPSR